MGFSKVFKALQEIFPQLDTRVLRAVAIEHSKDVDAAVEIVLSEIVPFFTERSESRTPSSRSISIGKPFEGAIATTQIADGTTVKAVGPADLQNGFNVNVGNQKSFHDAIDEHTEPFHGICDGHEQGEGNTAELTLPGIILGDSVHTNIGVISHAEDGDRNTPDSTLSGSIVGNIVEKDIDVHSHSEDDRLINKDCVNAHQIEVLGDPRTSETISDDKYPESSIRTAPDDINCHSLGTLQNEDNGTNQNINLIQGSVDNDHLETEFGTDTDKEDDQGKTYGDGNSSVVGSASLTSNDPTTIPYKSNSQLQNMYGSGLEELDVSSPNNTASKTETASNIFGTEDECALNTSMTQSSQISIINALEEIITDARNNKKTLFSSMQSVISLMKKVELKEQAAEQAKVEAAIGGAEILVKSVELKQMVQQLEEANAMHAGEVYGEKAILATELRELQSRVLSLSDERDKSLAVLDEMRQTLEVRLADAQNEIKSAEKEKLEKEKAAMEVLAEQELIMEKVVQESKIIKQQAEDNAKLQEFLVDRGHVVDMLQGEIAVICQDVRLLKEKFDEHVPFSKSLSSSQTSCILASSCSSSKSLILEEVESLPNETADSLKTQKERGTIASSERSFDEDPDRRALLDDGWELFDNREIYS